MGSGVAVNRRQLLQLLGLGPVAPMLPDAPRPTLVQPVTDWKGSCDPLGDIKMLLDEIHLRAAVACRIPESYLRGEGPRR